MQASIVKILISVWLTAWFVLNILPLSFSYNELLFIIDTCQGASMYERFYSPNIMALASSQVGEDSLSVGTYFLFVNCIVFGICSCFVNHLYA